jgi:protein-tyrosine phosphatase
VTTEMLPRLYQGGAIPVPKDFDVVALIASEWQPPDSTFGGARVLRLPLLDLERTYNLQRLHAKVYTFASALAELYKHGHKIAITCLAGRNRSGLVMGYVLRILGMAPVDAAYLIRQKRDNSLSNQDFLKLVLSPWNYNEKTESRTP